MKKKRHAKLMRAFATKIHVYGMKNFDDYKSPLGRDMYRCVRLAENGFIHLDPLKGINSRQDLWIYLKPSLELFGMGDIKELKKERN